jgi:FkbM family methyltransferase
MTTLRATLGRLMYRFARQLPSSAIAALQGVSGRSSRARRILQRVTRVAREGVHEIASGPAAGMLIDIAGSRPSYVLGTAEPEMQQFLEANVKPGGVVLDLGANVGFFSLVCAALVGSQGRVVAYEPFPGNAAALRRNVALNRLTTVEVVQAAIAREAGTAIFSVGLSDQDGSLLKRAGAGNISVATVGIDDEMRRLGLQPTLIKIDIEGAEVDAIGGMTETLETARPVVVCEMHQTVHDPDHSVNRTLRGLGYTVSWLEEGVDEATSFWAPHLIAIP